MDIVYIRNLCIATIIGVYDWERQVRQIVSLDLEMGADISRAADTDDIQYALDYKAVADRLTAFIGGSEFLLLETMAEQVATIVRTEFSVPWLRLRIGKPDAIAEADDVGVLIERGARH
ncbi:MAG: dihydroneopterin aldolase [Porticoccus sp.]|jgi:dihydroneopterin aldolase|uniref:dihydroneopterin aldolase n=1 Tax=Porticoccus sp. TaxID=2024853 RepID=UPI0039E2488C